MMFKKDSAPYYPVSRSQGLSQVGTSSFEASLLLQNINNVSNL